MTALFLFVLGVASLVAADVSSSQSDSHSSRALRSRRIAEGANATIVGGSEQTSTISYFVHFSSGACGATLITADTVLTAAHCVDSGFPSSVRVAARTSSDGLTVNVDTSNSAIHPQWTGNLEIGYDVAVLKLSSSVDTGTYPPVTLNSDCFAPCMFASMTTYGFGQTSSGGSTSSVLKVLQTTYQGLTSTPAYMLTRASSSSGVCFGDSGGPLLIGTTQYGVTSFIQGDCAIGNPDGFARVSSYYGWIQSQVCAVASDTTNFDCSATGACGAAIRDGMIRFAGGTRSAVNGVASFFGLGPTPLHDPKVFPMWNQS